MIAEALLGLMVTFSSPAEHECLAKNIYFEARNQSVAGKIAVAQVVINRANSPRFPNTICKVVYQGIKQKNGSMKRHLCQFSWYCDGLSDKPINRAAWEESQLLASDAMALYKQGYDGTSGAMWYHAKNVKPYWISDFDYVAHIDDHLFYRTKK